MNLSQIVAYSIHMLFRHLSSHWLVTERHNSSDNNNKKVNWKWMNRPKCPIFNGYNIHKKKNLFLSVNFLHFLNILTNILGFNVQWSLVMWSLYRKQYTDLHTWPIQYMSSFNEFWSINWQHWLTETKSDVIIESKQ